MGEYSEPYDGGPLLAEEAWTEMWDVATLAGIPPNMPTSLEVYTNEDGRQVRIRPGRAYIKGHRYRNDADIIFNLQANTTGATRNDTLVLRFNRLEKRTYTGLFTGASGGAAATLGGNNDLYDMGLARLALPNGFEKVTSAMITDLRPIAGAKTVFPKLTWHRPGVAGAPGFQNGYGNFIDPNNENPRYSKDSLGIVRIEGMARKGTASLTAFTLPAGFRPAKNRNYIGLHGPEATPGTPCTIIVGSDGRVTPSSSGTGWVSFSGISFEAEQ